MPARERWEFDDEVTAVFDDMLERSIPQYQTMRRTVFDLGQRFGRRDDGLEPWVIDIGCSRGGAIAPFAEDGWAANGIEISEPMVEAARERFKDAELVQIHRGDLRSRETWDQIQGARHSPNLFLAILTLQFVPINYRQQIVRRCHDRLLPGGAMIVVEKVLGDGALIDEAMVDLYHDAKERAGYSREAIERKRLALEGVLVPVTAAWNEELLRKAGFREVDCFWRWANFAGWVAVR
jgi:tRNA (cmo5U34)-methyltransferase